MKFLILNGPNLNLLGRREPDIYGNRTYDDLCKLIRDHASACRCQVELLQSNHEGALIDAIQTARNDCGGIVINPGAYAHYSYALYDALRCAANRIHRHRRKYKGQARTDKNADKTTDDTKSCSTIVPVGPWFFIGGGGLLVLAAGALFLGKRKATARA